MNLRFLSFFAGALLPLLVMPSASAVVAPGISVGGLVLGEPDIVSVTSNVSTGAGNTTQLIDQSGLSANYTSLVTPFSPFLNSTTTQVQIGANGWRSSSGQTVTLTFTLDDIYQITGIGLWQTGGASITARQVQGFTVWADSDANINNGLGTAFGSFVAQQQTDVPYVGQAWGVAQTPWNTKSTQFIHLQVTSNYGGNGVSLGEVVFAVPEPLTMLGASLEF